MQLFRVAASLLAAFTPFVLAVVEEDSDGVLVLTADNFEEAVAAHDPLLVEFYAPWCGHCKTLAPEFGKAARTLAADAAAAAAPLRLAKMDATAAGAGEVAQRFGVRGYPTLKFFRGGVPAEYEGERSADEIVKFVRKRSGPTTRSDVATLQQLHTLFTNNAEQDVVVLGFFGQAGEAAADAQRVFEGVAAGFDDVAFVSVPPTATELYAEYGVHAGHDHVVLLKKFDEMRVDLDGKTGHSPFSSAEVLTGFIKNSAMRLVEIFSQANSKKIFGSGIDVHLLVFSDKTAAHHDAVMEAAAAAARPNRGKVLTVHVPETESGVSGFFGFKPADFPKAVLVDMSQGAMKKFIFEGTDVANHRELVAFVEEYHAGSLVPSLKTEEPQPADTTSPVTVLRGKTFKHIVMDNTDDVLVEFYAPWCGHCKSLAPIWDQLGQRMQGVEGVRIAKMDSTANEIDIEGVEVRGFPTIYFFKGNDKSHPVVYSGGRTLDSIVSYLEENAVHSVHPAGAKPAGSAAAAAAHDADEL